MPVNAQDFVQRLRGTVFLVTLNACVSATPGLTKFSNVAAALVGQQTPYALGMRYSISDKDARAFSRSFYSDLARGVPVEEALRQARITLVQSSQAWAVGVPVLYTALDQAAPGFVVRPGIPRIETHQPILDLKALPRTEGAFQGRDRALRTIGDWLTNDQPPRFCTIHGKGGQGKTSLAREAVERFAWNWPGGAWSYSLNTLPVRDQMLIDLAHFLGINTRQAGESQELERQVVVRLSERRTLLVFDNAETLIAQVKQGTDTAIELVECLRTVLANTTTLLFTSQETLGWAGEVIYELGGLNPNEGRRLFCESASRRRLEANEPLSVKLSEYVDGHPLSLRLLGIAFDRSNLSLEEFVNQYESELINSNDSYTSLEHRHHTLYASLRTSLRYLQDEERNLLKQLWIFKAPFRPEFVVSLLQETQSQEEVSDESSSFSTNEQADSDNEPEHVPNHVAGPSPIRTQLNRLWQSALLTREVIPTDSEDLLFYRVPPPVRTYIENELADQDTADELLNRFAIGYLLRLGQIEDVIATSTSAVREAQICAPDIARGLQYLDSSLRIFHQYLWGHVSYLMGDWRYGLRLLEQAIEEAEGTEDVNQNWILNALLLSGEINRSTGAFTAALDTSQRAMALAMSLGNQGAEISARNNLALVYRSLGRWDQAIEEYERVLSFGREQKKELMIAQALNNIALVYRLTHRVDEAISRFEEALELVREIGNRREEASILNNLARAYEAIHKPERGRELLEQSITILRELGARTLESVSLRNLAYMDLELNQPQRALESLEQALMIQRALNLNHEIAITIASMGDVYRKMQRQEKALLLYEQARASIAEFQDPQNEYLFLDRLGDLLVELEQPERALAIYEEALPIVRALKDHRAEMELLAGIANLCAQNGETERAIAYRNDQLRLARTNANRTAETIALNALGNLYMQLGQYRQAIEHLEVALSIVQTLDSVNALVQTQILLSANYEQIGRLDRALSLAEAVLPALRNIDDRESLRSLLTHLGRLYNKLDMVQQAYDVLSEALDLAQELQNREEIAIIGHMLAMALSTLGQVERSQHLYEQSIAIARESLTPQQCAHMLANYGNLVGQLLHRHQHALSLYQEALPIFQQTGDKEGEAHTLASMGLIYNSIGDQQRALSTLQDAEECARQADFPVLEALSLHSKGLTLEALDQPADAEKAFRRAMELASGAAQRRLEIASIVDLALLLNQYLDKPQEALEMIERAMDGMVEYELPTDSSGRTPAELNIIRRRIAANLGLISTQLSTLSPDTVDAIRAFLSAPDWVTSRDIVLQQSDLLLQNDVIDYLEFQSVAAQIQGDYNKASFYQQHIILLRDALREGIDVAFEPLLAQGSSAQFDPELIPRSIAAILGTPKEKLSHIQYLNTLVAQSDNSALHELIDVIELAMLGQLVSPQDSQLRGSFREAWDAITFAVLHDGVSLQQIHQVIQNTVIAIRSVRENIEKWHTFVLDYREQARQNKQDQFAAFLTAVLALLDEGNVAPELGASLEGVYMRAWQVIIDQIQQS